MNLIRHNPYHVIGIFAGANQQTIARQKDIINSLQMLGTNIEFDTDLDFTGKPDRSNGAVEKALTSIEINRKKLSNALFWFASHNRLDETALNYLQSEDLEKAAKMWHRVTLKKEVSSENFTAYNNLGTLILAIAFANESVHVESLKEAVRLKTELLMSKNFSDFCHLVTDETYSVDPEKELEAFINTLLEETQKTNSIEAKKIPTVLASIHPKIRALLSEKLTDTAIDSFERETEQIRKARNENPRDSLELAKMPPNEAGSVASYLFGGVFGFAGLLITFIKSPTSFHRVSILDESLKKAAALYLVSGAISIYVFNKLNEQSITILREPAPFADFFSFLSAPIVGELFYAISGLLTSVMLMPASLILKANPPGKSFKQISLFLFSMGSIGAGLQALITALAALPTFSAEPEIQFIIANAVSGAIPLVVTFLFAPFFMINLKRFLARRSWGRIVAALIVSYIVSVIVIILLVLLLGLFFYILER